MAVEAGGAEVREHASSGADVRAGSPDLTRCHQALGLLAVVRKGLTLHEIAARSNLSIPTVRAVFAGEPASSRTLYRLSEGLGFKAQTLSEALAMLAWARHEHAIGAHGDSLACSLAAAAIAHDTLTPEKQRTLGLNRGGLHDEQP